MTISTFGPLPQASLMTGITAGPGVLPRHNMKTNYGKPW